MPLEEGQCHGSRADQEAPAPAIRPWSHPGTRPWSYYFDRRARREACITVELLKRDQIAGYYNIAAASFGLQAGIQGFAYAMFFMTDSALLAGFENHPSQSVDVDSAHHIETAKPFARAEVVSTGKGLLDRVARLLHGKFSHRRSAGCQRLEIRGGALGEEVHSVLSIAPLDLRRRLDAASPHGPAHRRREQLPGRGIRQLHLGLETAGKDLLVGGHGLDGVEKTHLRHDDRDGPHAGR